MRKLPLNDLLLFPTLLLVLGCDFKSSAEIELFSEENPNWFTAGSAKWTFDKGILVGNSTGDGGFVMTNNSYGDYVLELEFFPDSKVNSGVFVRCQSKDISATHCFEINIWDQHPNQEARTGAIVTRTKPLEKVHTVNKWNSYKIQCRESRVQAWINGVKVAEVSDDSLLDGYIGLQAAEKGRIKFRNIRLVRLND